MGQFISAGWLSEMPATERILTASSIPQLPLGDETLPTGSPMISTSPQTAPLRLSSRLLAGALAVA
ncbi:hypothetical protein ACFSZS_05345 [Seohaeicola zhoushanensis]